VKTSSKLQVRPIPAGISIGVGALRKRDSRCWIQSRTWSAPTDISILYMRDKTPDTVCSRKYVYHRRSASQARWIADAIRSYGLIFVVGCLLPFHAVAQNESEDTPPRVMRYLSGLDEYAGQACFGLVLTDRQGIPDKVYSLAGHSTALCTDAAETTDARLLEQAFDAAATVARQGKYSAAFTEILPQDRLDTVVQPPVGISLQQLVSGQRFIVGIGLNYREHREETGAEDNAGLSPGEVLVFPKVVAPTGAYAAVHAGARVGEFPARPVRLLDYEAELGMVLLEDLDLSAPPESYTEFINGVAFFTANDVSDREPIILDSEFGYTRGKSHPTYLPAGPWMIHGRDLQPAAPGEGHQNLELGLVVQEPAQEARMARIRQLQSSSTERMIFGPWQIVRLLAARYQQGIRTCMRDASGAARYTHTPAGIIPAGSVILTGTPGGTAIQAPGLLDKIDLFLRGGFSIPGARQRMISDSESHIEDSRYLQPGDQVETSITLLGRQRWTVVLEDALDRYGIDAPGDCSTDLDIDLPVTE
jgi:2-keto-4-pentenoate hydratase/2-oxohepta-3-ene-1,7-dioic acid hydratase in catechol pathway